MMSTATQAGATPASAGRGKAANPLALVRESATTRAAATTIMLADPHVLFRAGMRSLLPSLGSAVEVVEVGQGEALIPAIERAGRVDLLLIDPSGANMGGLATVQEIRGSFPNIPVIIVSGTEDRAAIDRALSLGARGYVTKTTPSELTVAALRLVLSGGTYVPSTFFAPQPAQDEPSAVPTLATADLTPRQREVLELLARGCPNKEIAQRLGMAVGTVKIHMTAILRALDVKNRTQAVLAAMQMGFGRGQSAARAA
jgi:DNA-binding NarL/FixJ family response regulator